ncbi:GxxExxY protein [Bacteroides sp. OttesenSCG-928-E20]|nr:GxxExxY protein [Bacteroides sp. OttesenSCG-928-N06]MDL2299558.1 GxxExxY protein [Bacteroides sp. OttesenSCG-928-E20]MDL2304739.1 GxxExxY protein [Bacteroides sp. OttesenSCG-928-D19]
MVHIDKETNELAYKVIGCAYKVHRSLGPGLLESAYEACLCYELDKENIKYEKQKELPVIYDEKKIDCGYRLDVLIESKIIIELKSTEKLLPIHTAQVMTYLRLSKVHLGLLINFNEINLQNGIRRYVL